MKEDGDLFLASRPVVRLPPSDRNPSRHAQHMNLDPGLKLPKEKKSTVDSGFAESKLMDFLFENRIKSSAIRSPQVTAATFSTPKDAYPYTKAPKYIRQEPSDFYELRRMFHLPLNDEWVVAKLEIMKWLKALPEYPAKYEETVEHNEPLPACKAITPVGFARIVSTLTSNQDLLEDSDSQHLGPWVDCLPDGPEEYEATGNTEAIERSRTEEDADMAVNQNTSGYQQIAGDVRARTPSVRACSATSSAIFRAAKGQAYINKHQTFYSQIRNPGILKVGFEPAHAVRSGVYDWRKMTEPVETPREESACEGLSGNEWRNGDEATAGGGAKAKSTAPTNLLDDFDDESTRLFKEIEARQGNIQSMI